MNPDNKNIYYPPAGILLWIIIFLEVITFTIGIAVFLYQKNADYDTFVQSQALLNKTLGMVNTLVLITGGFMMATSLHQLKNGDNKRSLLWIRGAILMGVVFLSIKGYEYYDKLGHGLSIDYDSFFTFYWLLTGFHFIHVLVGVVILLFLAGGFEREPIQKKNTLMLNQEGLFGICVI